MNKTSNSAYSNKNSINAHFSGNGVLKSSKSHRKNTSSSASPSPAETKEMEAFNAKAVERIDVTEKRETTEDAYNHPNEYGTVQPITTETQDYISSDKKSKKHRRKMLSSEASSSSTTNASASSASISRMQIYGSNRRSTNLIRTSSDKNGLNQDEWKSPAERVNVQKGNSFAFRFTQAMNSQPSLKSEKSGSAGGSGSRPTTPVEKSQIQKRSKGLRPATPYRRTKVEAYKSLDQSTVPSIAGSSVTFSQDSGILYDEHEQLEKREHKELKEQQKTRSQREKVKTEMDALSNPTQPAASAVPTSPRSQKRNSNANTDGTSYPRAACNVALSIVGGIGSAVEHCIDQINKLTDTNTGDDENEELERRRRFEITRMPSLDTIDQQLMNEVDRLDRMNSWETAGSFNTMNTAATGNTTDTADLSLVSEVVNMDDDAVPAASYERQPQISKSSQDEDSILLSEIELNTHISKSRSTTTKKKPNSKKKKGRKRAVNFQYPPISSMKECPRVTEEERKSLFFTAAELDEYEHDRKYNLCDDIEVVAVEFSDDSDEEDESGSDEGGDLQAKSSQGNSTTSSLKPSLRTGKYFKAVLGDGGGNGGAAASTRDAKNAISPQSSKGGSSRGTGKSSRNSNSGRIKGVQIYLRQRSVR